jgi:hypothetical protein
MTEKHSKLGGSKSEQFMECSGSVFLASIPFDLKEDDNDEWRGPGKQAHALAAKCLDAGQDAWEQDFPSAEMGNYVQTYLDSVRLCYGTPEGFRRFVELPISHPAFHPAMFGTLDHAALHIGPDKKTLRVHVDDFKYGVGVVVDVVDNSQLMYYAFCFMDGENWPADLPRVTDDCPVELSIHQPRVTWRESPQTWITTAGAIRKWAYDVLYKAMKKAGTQEYKVGSWCQFCPRQLACPQQRDSAEEVLSVADKFAQGALDLTDLSDDWIGHFYIKQDTNRMFWKALADEVSRRARMGREHSSWKFIDAKTDREWKDDAVAETDALGTSVVPLLTQRFGDDAFEPRAFKSPAQIEKLGVVGKAFVAEFAQKPKAGQRVVPSTDKHRAVKRETDEQRFAGTPGLDPLA